MKLKNLFLPILMLTSFSAFTQTELGINSNLQGNFKNSAIKGIGLEVSTRSKLNPSNYFDLELNLNQIRTIGVTTFTEEPEDKTEIALLAFPVHYIKELGTDKSLIKANLAGLGASFAFPKEKGATNITVTGLGFVFVKDQNQTTAIINDYLNHLKSENPSITESELNDKRDDIETGLADIITIHNDGVYIVPIRKNKAKHLQAIKLRWLIDVSLISQMNHAKEVQNGVGLFTDVTFDVGYTYGRVTPFIRYSNMNASLNYKFSGEANYNVKALEFGIRANLNRK